MTRVLDSPPTPHRVLSLKAAVVFTCIVVAGSVGLGHLHRRQVAATVHHLKKTADDAVDAGRAEDAIRALELYLTFRGDPDAVRTLAILLDDSAPDEETRKTAWMMMDEILLDHPEDAELRLRQVRLALKLQHLPDAESHLTLLRKQRPDDPDVFRLSGLVAARMERPEKAEAFLRRAIRLGTDQADTWTVLAMLLEDRHASEAEVESLLREACDRSGTPESICTLAVWLKQRGRLRKSLQEVRAGVSMFPDHEPLNTLLLDLVQDMPASDITAADRTFVVGHLREQSRQHPDRNALRLLAAHALWWNGQQDQAMQTLQSGLPGDGDSWDLHAALTDYLVRLKRPEAARDVFASIPRMKPNAAHWWFLQGRVQMGFDRWRQAMESLERALGFAAADSRLRQQIVLCEAICCRKRGHSLEAVEACRSVLQSDPDSLEARLGLAAAWLESGHIDRAIAVYRQMPEEDGVAPLLASLLIQNILEQPPLKRRWNEVERLLDDLDSPVRDESQRIVLQADLLFAQGHPARALDRLDQAVLDRPGDHLIRAARRKILEDREGSLLDFMRQTTERTPNSLEAHITALRLLGHRGDLEDALAWLDRLRRSGKNSASRTRRPITAARAAEAAAADLEQSGLSEIAAALRQDSLNSWRQAAEQSADCWPDLAGGMARQRGVNAVRDILGQLPPDLDGAVRAQCWLEAVRNTTAEHAVFRQEAGRVLRHLTETDSVNPEVKKAYAEYLIQSGRMQDALKVFRGVLMQAADDVHSLARCAWILAMQGESLQEADRLSVRAAVLAPEDPDVLTVRGLVLAASRVPEQSLSVLRSMAPEQRSGPSRVCEAWALWQTGRSDAAARLIRTVCHHHRPDLWTPADQKLLNDMKARVRSSDESGLKRL